MHPYMIEKLKMAVTVGAAVLSNQTVSAEIFYMNRNYLCVTENAMYASPEMQDQGLWTASPKWFRINIKECTILCLPQKSREKPTSLSVSDPSGDWPKMFQGYRDERNYHAASGGSVVLSGTDLTLTRIFIGSMYGTSFPASMTLSARCHADV